MGGLHQSVHMFCTEELAVLCLVLCASADVLSCLMHVAMHWMLSPIGVVDLRLISCLAKKQQHKGQHGMPCMMQQRSTSVTEVLSKKHACRTRHWPLAGLLQGAVSCKRVLEPFHV